MYSYITTFVLPVWTCVNLLASNETDKDCQTEGTSMYMFTFTGFTTLFTWWNKGIFVIFDWGTTGPTACGGIWKYWRGTVGSICSVHYYTDIPHGDNQEGNNQPWCICNKCLNMDTPIENKCCRRTTCVTTTEPFETIVLDRDMSVAIVNRSDDFADEPDYSPSSYRKAAYRQWTMWQIGSTGRSNRRVIPSCVVRAVRNRYPAPDRIYLGYKES